MTEVSATERRPRSAEQTARLLLSNAFRYDTWEASAARRAVSQGGGDVSTITLQFADLASTQAQLPSDVKDSMVALNLALFDPAKKVFLGATYRVEKAALTEPISFQATPTMVLVIEVLVHRRGAKPQEKSPYQVTHWTTTPVGSLAETTTSLTLRPGNAHLLLLDQALWPVESRADEAGTKAGVLVVRCTANSDAALSALLRELVPPGIFVPQSFTKAAPKPGTRAFRLNITGIQLTGTSSDSKDGLNDPRADWSVAAVAHNGYQQLGNGAEVPLVLPRGRSSSSASSSSSSSTTASASREREAGGKEKPQGPYSQLPLIIDNLPVHAATSLVLAIRRRDPGQKSFKVVGFCVFPLCMMPMKDRDVRVENLPALRGPFSCSDARLLMVDSSTPYGRVPISATLTLSYFDTDVPAQLIDSRTKQPVARRDDERRHSELEELTGGTSSTAAPAGASPGLSAFEAMGLSPQSSGDARATPSAGAALLANSLHSPLDQPGLMTGSYHGGEGGVGQPSDTMPLSVGPQAISTSDFLAGAGAGGAASSSPNLTSPSNAAAGSAAMPTDSAGVFKLLCSIMEELQKVRESQEALLRRNGPLSMPPSSLAAQERMNQGLADGPINLVDLQPHPLAVSWKARVQMQQDLTPIMHPLTGQRLDDTVAAKGALPGSLFGLRFEGLTLDTALTMPEDVCFAFSFGPLPYQHVGPAQTASVEKSDTSESFKLWDSDGRGGLVWCEPVEALRSASMALYKESAANATVYVHIYDALTMFYVASAPLPLAHFHRPYNAECALMTIDLVLQRDLTLTQEEVPPKVLPAIRNAGQLHATLFCVGVSAQYTNGAKRAFVKEPETSSRLIVAKKLPHVDRLRLDGGEDDGAEEAAPAGHATRPAPPPSGAMNDKENDVPAVADAALHQQRIHHVKSMLEQQSGYTTGVPDAHLAQGQREAEMEFRLRYLENKREKMKSKAIAQTLMKRLTTEHAVQLVAWRPEVVKSSFQSPYSVPVQFFVEVAEPQQDACTVVGAPSFYLGPREQTVIPLALRLPYHRHAHAPADGTSDPNTHTITAKVYSERRELVRVIQIQATVGMPLIDRRYELFGSAGTTITRRFLSRYFSSSTFPIVSKQSELVQRMKDVCARVETSHEDTLVETNAVLDPITQTYITAWEEVSVSTKVPIEADRQRIEYITLYTDAAMTNVYETWELCVFACDEVVTRAIFWGQTTALGLPAEGTEELYCSDTHMAVTRHGPSYVLKVRPREIGSQKVLLHTLVQDTLRKTLLTIPTIYPTPTYTQVIELSMQDVAAPVFRRLTFVNRGDAEEVFTVHHNYRFQLQVTPKKFALAPGDTQFVSLQFDMLQLQPRQTEGRWPMWLFINNADDKTVESYALQIVLRAHPLIRTATGGVS